VDQELILKLAREIPEARLLLIGKADVDVTRLQGVNNIQLEGPKPFSQLPEFIAQFTVGIIPFEVNDLTRAVNPIKLREMLASGCPVVSTALPEVERCVHDGDGAVQVAHSHDEFVAMVRTVVGNPFPEEKRQRLSDSMVTETWSAKVDEILRCVGSESES
jgi:glycosyltransferase involved in cell wall biosynthesis